MTTWFAQNSGVNIDSANQWNDAADGSGNWLTWASLGASDVLVANGKTSITINVDVTCSQITSKANAGTAGGGFIISSAGRTVSADLQVGSGTLLLVSVGLGGQTNLIGDVNGSTTATSSICVSITGIGQINIVGNVIGPNQTFAVALSVAANAPIYILGNITGGSAGTNPFAVSGNNIAHTAGVSVVGNITGGGSGSGYAFWSFSALTLTVTGNCIANASSIGSVSLATIVGDLIASTTVGVFSINATTHLNGRLVCATNGRHPISVNSVVLVDDTIEQSHIYRVNNGGVAGAERSLYTGGVNLGQPVESDVREGVAFGASDEYEGTLIVPDPAFVSLGVPTDNTVGTLTAGLDESALHDALDSYAHKADWKATGFATPDNVTDAQTAILATLPESGRAATQASVDVIATDVDAANNYLSSITAKLGAITGSGVNTVLGFFKALLSKTATTPSDIGGAFSASTDSTEAIRDRGDAAWLSGSGGGGDPVTITVTVVGSGDPGDPIVLKQGSAVSLEFELLSAPTYTTFMLGVSDDSNARLLTSFGSIDGTTLTFDITSSQAMRLYEGLHNYDIFEVDGYNAETGAYTDARLLVSAAHGVSVLPKYVLLGDNL